MGKQRRHSTETDDPDKALLVKLQFLEQQRQNPEEIEAHTEDLGKLENFVRDALMSYAHQTCTAKMGRDSMSVVDATLEVCGVDNLSVADGSIMPRVTTGNTMAPCVIIGERAGEILRRKHKL